MAFGWERLDWIWGVIVSCKGAWKVQALLNFGKHIWWNILKPTFACLVFHWDINDIQKASPAVIIWSMTIELLTQTWKVCFKAHISAMIKVQTEHKTFWSLINNTQEIRNAADLLHQDCVSMIWLNVIDSGSACQEKQTAQQLSSDCELDSYIVQF